MARRKEGLQEFIDELNKRVQDCNYDLETKLKAIRYDKERVQTSNVSNEIEQALMNAHENTMRELTYADIENQELSSTILRLTIEVKEMDSIIESYDDQEALDLFVEYYRDGKSFRTLAGVTGLDHSVIRDMIYKAVEYVHIELGDCTPQNPHKNPTDSPQIPHQNEE